MYKSDLLTYSRGVQIRPSHIFMFTHISTTDEGSNNLRGPPGVRAMKVPPTSNQPSPSFPKLIPLPKGPGLRTCASERTFVTFGRTKAISFVTEGIGLCACASGQPSVTFGLQRVISFVPKVMVFELAPLSVHPIPSGMLGLLSLGLCKQVKEHFRR